MVFTKPTQYAIMHEPAPVASKMSGTSSNLLPKGLTVSFWIKVNEQPASTAYILRRKTEDVNVLSD